MLVNALQVKLQANVNMVCFRKEQQVLREHIIQSNLLLDLLVRKFYHYVTHNPRSSDRKALFQETDVEEIVNLKALVFLSAKFLDVV